MVATKFESPGIDSKYFKAIGLWQYVVGHKVTWYVILNFVLGAVFIVDTSFQFLMTLTSKFELSSFVEKLSVNLTITESAIKIVYYYMNRSKLHSLSSTFKNDLLLCSSHNGLTTSQVMSDSKSVVNNITKGFVIMIFSTVGIWNALPLLRCFLIKDCTDWHILPFWYPDSFMSSPVFIYTHEFFIMVFCAALLYNVNCFFSALALSLSFQFELLSKCLKTIVRNATKKGNPDVHVMDMLLRDCLIDHQRLLELAKEMEEMYNPLFLIQMLASTFTICLVLVQLNVHFSSNELPIAMTMKFFMYLLFGSVELLVYSWGGQILYNQAEEMHGSLYESGWNEGSAQFKKNIAIAMTRTMSPVYLSAGKFYRVDLSSFTQIIKASYSYFTFLHGSDSSSNK